MNNDKNYEVGTRERFGRNILKNTAEFVAEVFDKGNLAVVCDGNTAEYAGIVAKSLVDDGYFVREYVYAEGDDLGLDIAECVRFIVGVGSGKIADVARFNAGKMGIRYGLVATAPSTESYIVDGVGDLSCGFPEFVAVDFDVADKAPSFLAAAGYGRVIAQLPTIFDTEFSKLVFGGDYDAEAMQELQKSLHQFEKDKNQPNFKERLFVLLLKIARLRVTLDVKNTAVDCYAKVLASALGRTEGETSFLASYVVLNTYRLFLSREALDTLLPIDTVKTLKLLEKMRVINYNKYLSGMYVDTVADYFRRGFILGEYRQELYSKVENLDLTEISRFFRRIYDDAGFWLKSYASGAELLRYLSLAAELSEDCLLKYLKRLGFLERFI